MKASQTLFGDWKLQWTLFCCENSTREGVYPYIGADNDGSGALLGSETLQCDSHPLESDHKQEEAC
jgi:hypothetical protein